MGPRPNDLVPKSAETSTNQGMHRTDTTFSAKIICALHLSFCLRSLGPKANGTTGATWSTFLSPRGPRLCPPRAVGWGHVPGPLWLILAGPGPLARIGGRKALGNTV